MSAGNPAEIWHLKSQPDERIPHHCKVALADSVQKIGVAHGSRQNNNTLVLDKRGQMTTGWIFHMLHVT